MAICAHIVVTVSYGRTGDEVNVMKELSNHLRGTHFSIHSVTLLNTLVRSSNAEPHIMAARVKLRIVAYEYDTALNDGEMSCCTPYHGQNNRT